MNPFVEELLKLIDEKKLYMHKTSISCGDPESGRLNTDIICKECPIYDEIKECSKRVIAFQAVSDYCFKNHLRPELFV